MSTSEKRHRCGAPVLEGISDLGLDVLLDTTELTPVTELEAILDGRRTFTLHTWADEIAHRSPSRIVAHPAGTRPRTVVHPAHRCEESQP